MQERPTGDRNSFQRPGSDVWRGILNQVSTRFGRLVFLASLRDEATGLYGHPTLSRMLGDAEADRTLCHSHHQVFSQWIGLSLEEQKNDVDDYLRQSGEDPRSLRGFRRLAPPSARDVERQLYLTDLETVLELLKYERGGVFSIPESSPPR